MYSKFEGSYGHLVINLNENVVDLGQVLCQIVLDETGRLAGLWMYFLVGSDFYKYACNWGLKPVVSK